MPNDKSETGGPMHSRDGAREARNIAAPGVLGMAEVERLIDELFPQVHVGGRVFFVEAAAHKCARVRMKPHEKNLRPGNTLSGPSMFQLADLALYVAILSTVGAGALQAVTTTLNIKFLSRPALADLVADVSLMKVGKRLIVGEVEMVQADTLVAHAIATYAMPTARA